MTEATIVDFDVRADPNGDGVVTTFWIETAEGLDVEILRLSKNGARTLGRVLEEQPLGWQVLFVRVTDEDLADFRGGEWE